MPDRLQFRPLAQDDVVRSLSLGSVQFTPLKKFLAKESKELHFAHLARTLVAVEPGTSRVYAYATLVCASVAVERLGAPIESMATGMTTIPQSSWHALQWISHCGSAE